MFRLLGKKVELIRYIVHWQAEGRDMKERCVSEEHRNAVEQGLIEQNIEFTTKAIDQTGNEWINGLEFDSYDEALEAFNAGEEIYNQQKSIQHLTDNLRLRADIDYLAIMAGVEI